MPTDSEHREIADFQVGATIGRRYEIVDQLGSGAMGLVLKVRDRALDNDVLALKILYPHLVQDETLFQRFMNEVVIARKLTHPNIVRTHDIGRDERGYFYISMEYIEGRSLDSRIYDKEHPLRFEEAVNLLKQIASGLAYAHERGVIHRDLKPANILLTPEGQPRIADFGLAESLFMRKGLTKTGESVGTPAYMAPEQIQGEEIDARADIYALGIIAFEMASCDRPFKDENWFRIAAQQILEPLPPIVPKMMVLPPWFEPFVQKCTSKQPADRFESAAEVVEALDGATRVHATPEAARSNFASTFQKPSRPTKSFRDTATQMSVWGGGVAALFFCFLFFVFLVLPRPTKQTVLFSIEQSTGLQLPIVKRAFGIRGSQTSEAFLTAAQYGDAASLDGMIAAGINVNTRDPEGRTGLMLAARSGSIAALESILKAPRIDRDALDNSQRSALSYALETKNKALVEKLLDYGTSVTAPVVSGSNALQFAIETKAPSSLIELLLDRGVDPNKRDAQGRTALLRALYEKDENLVRLLLAHNADRTAIDPSTGVTTSELANRQGFSYLFELNNQASANQNLSRPTSTPNIKTTPQITSKFARLVLVSQSLIPADSCKRGKGNFCYRAKVALSNDGTDVAQGVSVQAFLGGSWVTLKGATPLDPGRQSQRYVEDIRMEVPATQTDFKVRISCTNCGAN